jgi:hypothetical protein
MVLGAAFNDDETPNESLFESLIEYNLVDFKDFTDIITRLMEFRKQLKEVKFTYTQTKKKVDDMCEDLQKIDAISEFYREDEEWVDEVRKLKAKYLQLSNYDQVRIDLSDLETQKDAMETISSEFSIKENQAGICPLCYENTIDMFLDPCGHVCCTACWTVSARSIRQNTCPCCRTPVAGKRMFLI